MVENVKDILFTQKDAAPFAFDADVSRVFEDMIQRSVPGYGLTLQMISVIAGLYAQENSKLYDLGCSLGASSLALAHGIKVDDCEIIGVDNSAAMLEKCRSNTQQSPVTIVLQQDDIQNTVIEDASVVVLNFTLQFIAKEARLLLLKRIYKGMRKGGVLVLSEKVCFVGAFEQQQHIALHESFKKAQGYSELEVSRKRQSLENVLIPEPISAHHARLKTAGFDEVQTWFQCFNFTSMLAYKR
ncbi:MAG TPA: carboxy-S-adenosyl-L-methionine synthase CmoA [Ghiorsea sp.]|nr:carboxy-S-adenosyl-L-methionine synthase CmoA [Ghiorsea sp.]HIP06838.1 carboxy-S-adenosyl-L-methionine synthase CmoA [Mariprofundaceae bacterium]